MRISVTLDSETVKAIDDLGTTRSRFIEEACKEALSRRLALGSTPPLQDVNDELVDILLDHVQVDDKGKLF